jgi:molybdenum cofactor cytidylyltransferase
VTPEGLFAGVVLAAGTSSRLGRPKQLLELDGRPVLQHVLDAAAGAGLDEIVVVLGHEASAIEASIELPAGARTVFNPDFAAGQSTSLRVGLDAVSPEVDVAVILLGDQPRMGPDLITSLVDRFMGDDKPVLRPTFRGAPGHPVIAARSAWESMRAAAGDTGARDALLSMGEMVRSVEMGTIAPADVDTWEQYERLRSD